MIDALDEQKRQFVDGIPECGADALRMALCSYNYKGKSYRLGWLCVYVIIKVSHIGCGGYVFT